MGPVDPVDRKRHRSVVGRADHDLVSGGDPEGVGHQVGDQDAVPGGPLDDLDVREHVLAGDRRVSRLSDPPRTETGTTFPRADSTGSSRYGLEATKLSNNRSTRGSTSPFLPGPGSGIVPLRYMIPTPHRV